MGDPERARRPVESRALLGAAASLALLWSLASPVAARAADAYVDEDTGTDSATCGAMNDPCETIPTGIDNAGNNETVRVDDTAAAYTGGGLNLGFGKSLVAQEFVGGDENALAEPDTIIDMGLPSFFPAISVPPGGGGGTIQGFVVRSLQQPVSLQASTTLTGNLIDEGDSLLTCQVNVSGSGNTSTIGPNNTFVDPTPMATPKAGVCVADSAVPMITSNTFTDLNPGVQSGGGSSTIDSNLFTGTRGTTSDAAIEVSSGPALSIRSNTIVDPGDTFVSGIILRQPAETPIVGATMRRNTIIGHRFGVIITDTEATVLMDSSVIAKSSNAGLAQTDTGDDDDANVTATNLTIFDSTSSEISLSSANLALNSSIVGSLGITASGTAGCTIQFSRGPVMMGGGSGCSNFQTTLAPGFTNPTADDYHLAAGSAMIDSGDPAVSVFPQDIDGEARAADGNGDGIVRRDVGADETPTLILPPPPPPPAPGTGSTSTSPGSAPGAKGKRCKKKRKRRAAASKRCKRKRRK